MFVDELKGSNIQNDCIVHILSSYWLVCDAKNCSNDNINLFCGSRVISSYHLVKSEQCSGIDANVGLCSKVVSKSDNMMRHIDSSASESTDVYTYTQVSDVRYRINFVHFRCKMYCI